jgi:hypothetical protein
MTLLDRFRAQPPQKHSDPSVRLAYVQEIPIDERDLLAEIAREDVDARVRRAAVAKLMDPSALAAVLEADPDPGVRDAALAMLRDIALDAFEGIAETESLAAVEALADTRILATVAKTALREEVALRALGRVREAHALGSIARHARLEPIRLAALEALRDRAEIVAVALNSDFKDTAIAAVERLDDRGDLEQVAARGKNKIALKRARAMLREMDDRAATQPVVTDTADPSRGEGRGALPPDEPSAAIAATDDGGGDGLERSEESVDVARPEETARIETDAAGETGPRATTEAGPVAEAGPAAPPAPRREEKEREEKEVEAEAETERRRQEEQARQRVEEEAEQERRRQEERTAQERQRLAERAEAQAREARVRQAALARLTQFVARVEPLAATGEVAGTTGITLRAAERALRDVRAALADLPALPSKREHDEMTERLKKVQAALTAKVQELRELSEWQRWANLGVQEQLCAKMEALNSVEDPVEIARQVHALQEQWRAASDVPRPQGEALWRRFKAAHDIVWARCAAHFAAEAEARAQNLARKIALCEKAEALADSTRWIPTAEEIKRLQLEWKSISAVTRGQEKLIWERFRSACDRFFTRRQADLAEHKKRWAANMAKKEALCAQVEALADSTDWDATAVEIRRLQNEWKTVGPVKKSRSEAIWQRFRGACDRFFARHAQRHEIARGERVAAREAICAELESLAPPPQEPDSAPRPAPDISEPEVVPGSTGPEVVSGSTGSEIASTDSGSTVSDVEPSTSSGRPDLSTGSGSPVEGRTPQELLTAVRALRARWQQEIAARGVDRDRAAVLDQRFAAAFARVLAAFPAAFAGSDLDPDANRKRMEALVRRMEELAGSATASGGAAEAALSPATRLAEMLKEALAANTIGGKVDEDSRMRAAAEEVRQAQASWARIGQVPDAARRVLTDRFTRACRRIMEKAGGAVGAGRAGGAGNAGGTGR